MMLSRWKIMAGMLTMSAGGLAALAANCPKTEGDEQAKDSPQSLALADPPPAIPPVAPPAGLVPPPVDKKPEPLAPPSLPTDHYKPALAGTAVLPPMPAPIGPGALPAPTGPMPPIPASAAIGGFGEQGFGPPLGSATPIQPDPSLPLPAPTPQKEHAKEGKKPEGGVLPPAVAPIADVRPALPAGVYRRGIPATEVAPIADVRPALPAPAPILAPPATAGGPNVGVVEPPLTGKPNVTPPAFEPLVKPTPTLATPITVQPPVPSPVPAAPTAPVTPAVNVTPATPSGPAVVPASSLSASTKLRIVLRVGEGEPTFEVRSGDDLLMKVVCEKVDVTSPDKGAGLSAVKARGKVHFAGFGAEGTCEELGFLAGTGEVSMTGNVRIQVKDKLGRIESELTCEAVKYRIDASAIGGMLKP